MAEAAPARAAGQRAAARRRPPRRSSRPSTTNRPQQADLSARMEALKALQEKVKTDGKLKPWLAKHGLDGLQGLWSRIHIEQGWENALEAALRERLGALEVSRLDMVRAFGRRCAAGQAGVLQPAAGRRAGAGRQRPAAPGRPAAPERRRPEGRAGRLAARLPDRGQPRRSPGAARQQLQPGEVILRARAAMRSRAQRELLRAGLRAGRPAGARPGNRKPRKAAARPRR